MVSRVCRKVHHFAITHVLFFNPDIARAESIALSGCSSPRFETIQPTAQCELRSEGEFAFLVHPPYLLDTASVCLIVCVFLTEC